MDVSVVIPTHNPHAGRLRRALAGLRAQTLPSGRWETILIDNASSPPVDAAAFTEVAPPNLRLTHEPQLGLTSARRHGFNEARAPLCVLVDDDNVLAPDYLEHALRLFAAHPRVGAFGGRIVPEFETTPPPWIMDFSSILALRDHGDATRISHGLWDEVSRQRNFPWFSPVGAGMALRRPAVDGWLRTLNNAGAALITDRRGSTLTSGGDTDILFTLMDQGWEVAYFPELRLTHLIPQGRLRVDYLARLNRSIQQSWIQVLDKHDANPWPPIAPWTVPLRKLKAWFVYRAWSGPVARIRWQGACGHFEGRAVRPSSIK